MKVYIPTMEELEKLQKLGVDIYGYLVAKVTETIIMEDIIYEEGDMFEILEYLGPHPEILYAICKLYPEKISQSIITSKDKDLCKMLISTIRKEDKTIYELENILKNFDKSILFDKDIVKNTLKFIASNLSQCPRYRFDYMAENPLLDSIFSCELPQEHVAIGAYANLAIIDPIYSIKYSQRSKENDFITKRGMISYLNRYEIDQYSYFDYNHQDIINKPNDDVKKLIKCLEYHKKNYQ